MGEVFSLGFKKLAQRAAAYTADPTRSLKLLTKLHKCIDSA